MPALLSTVALLAPLLLAPSPAPTPAPAWAPAWAPSRAPGDVGFVAEDLPPGWELTREDVLDPLQVVALGRKLGVPLQRVRNQHLALRGFPLKVVLVDVETDEHADALVERLSAGGRAEFVARDGTTVVEFANMNLLAAKALRHQLGLAPAAPATWRVRFRVACVDALDYMEANRVFNLFLQLAEDPAGEGPAEQIRLLTADWTPGDTLHLRAPGPGHAVEYAFDPEPRERTVEGERLRVRFDDLPASHGLPYVDVTATIRVGDRFAPTPAPEAPAQAEAPRWPAEARAVEALAAELVGDDPEATDLDRLRAVFDHVAIGIRFDGDVTGSRYGVVRVLEQGYGHCWDKSDALVTLCRAAGLRARQTAGWVPPLGSGHVWSEVWIDDRGWLPVDATCRWLGTSADYVPWFLTEDGEMPIVYLSWPELERVD